jgi:signal transduction histidine kinase
LRPAQEPSIAGKLTRMNMFVSVAALVLACVTFIACDLVTFTSTTVRNLSIEAQIIGANSTSELLFDDPQSGEKTLSALRAAPGILSAGIYGEDGRLFASYLRDRGAQSVAATLPLSAETERHSISLSQIVLVHTIVFKGKVVGYVSIRSDVQELKQRLTRYAGIAAVVLCLCILAALPISSIYGRAIASPIESLASIARTVAQDKSYSVRAPDVHSTRELTMLVGSFNEMLEQIKKRDGELREAHDEQEQRVRERTAELVAANKELEAFSYSVSHDLRAPLRSIDGFSLALLEDCGDKLDATGKEHLHRVRAATQRMSQLIDDMLDLSRVTRSEMQRENVDLTRLAKSIADDLHKENPDRRVEFSIADGLTVNADARLLKVVIENLLNNAWKYTSGHEQARIEMGEMKQNGHRTYFVRDDGVSFDPRYVSRLFGAFQRLHAASDFPGTGVGLATVQRIINRHGGEVWAEGAVEHGATFYFSLAKGTANGGGKSREQ